MPQLITLTAEQTFHQAPALYRQLADALQQSADLILDLSQVQDIDCAGAQVLLWLLLAVQQQQGRLRLRQPSHAVSSLIHLMGLYPLQACLEDDDAA